MLILNRKWIWTELKTRQIIFQKCFSTKFGEAIHQDYRPICMASGYDHPINLQVFGVKYLFPYPFVTSYICNVKWENNQAKKEFQFLQFSLICEVLQAIFMMQYWSIDQLSIAFRDYFIFLKQAANIIATCNLKQAAHIIATCNSTDRYICQRSFRNIAC